MSWWRGSIVVAVGAAVLAAGAWWGLAREDGDDDRVEARPRPIALDVGGGTVDDHGSFEGRFEGDRVTAADQDGDDVYEIVVDGEVHRWNGREYREPA